MDILKHFYKIIFLTVVLIVTMFVQPSLTFFQILCFLDRLKTEHDLRV